MRVKNLSLQIKQNSLPHIGRQWTEKVSCCLFEIKRLKDDGKLTGELQMVLYLDIANTEQNQIS